MEQSQYQALIVDDEGDVRKATMRSLRYEGIACDGAADGREAEQMLKRARYDLVVTDLRMPNKHGHALAVDLLELRERPVIVVLTGVLEPRLVKDLMARGVDDVSLKPVDYDIFAAKVKGLVVQANQQQESQKTVSEEVGDDSVIGLSDMESKLSDGSKIVPVSQAALDVFDMVNSDSFNAQQIAVGIERDPSLAAEVLKLANNTFYNPSGEKITELKQAVARMGQKRVGELTLATSAMASLAPETLPWMDVGLAWRQCVAAGIAVELLVAQGGHQSLSEGLVFSALMHSSGRVVLGMHYPKQYEAMVKACTEHSEALLKHEQRVFPQKHVEVIVRLLADWKISSDVYRPLKYILNEYSSLASLSEPLRTKCELVKLAILIGRIAVGRWESWDLVEFPPSPVLDRLGIDSVSEIIEQTEADLQGFFDYQMQSQKKLARDPTQLRPQSRHLAYSNLSPEPFDFLAAIVPSMGISLNPIDFESGEMGENVLVNRIGALPERRTARIFSRAGCNIVFVRDADKMKGLGQIGKNVPVPCSYAALRSVCWEASGATQLQENAKEDDLSV